MKTDHVIEKRVDRLLRRENTFRRNRRLAVLVAVLCAIWVFSHEFGILGGPPANMFGLGMWLFVTIAVWSHIKVQSIELIRWCRVHPAT